MIVEIVMTNRINIKQVLKSNSKQEGNKVKLKIQIVEERKRRVFYVTVSIL